MTPIRYRIPRNHRINIFKSYFPILFKNFFLRPEMVFNRVNYFIVSKIFDKNQGNSVDIYFPYIRVSTHGHVQNIEQNLLKPFLPILRIWNISTGNVFIYIQGKCSKSQMLIVITLQSLISIKVLLVHQNAPKPSLTRIKLEQLCTTNFLPLTPTFVRMLTWTNEATTPSGASRRSDFLN